MFKTDELPVCVLVVNDEQGEAPVLVELRSSVGLGLVPGLLHLG
jgi:hypothetical protein